MELLFASSLLKLVRMGGKMSGSQIANLVVTIARTIKLFYCVPCLSRLAKDANQNRILGHCHSFRFSPVCMSGRSAASASSRRDTLASEVAKALQTLLLFFLYAHSVPFFTRRNWEKELQTPP